MGAVGEVELTQFREGREVAEGRVRDAGLAAQVQGLELGQVLQGEAGAGAEEGREWR